MPCTDGGVPFPPSREEVLQSKMPAALCALINVMRRQHERWWEHPVVMDVDWKEAGLSLSEVIEWFSIHDARDRARREREDRKHLEAAMRQRIEAKLTPAGLEFIKKLK